MGQIASKRVVTGTYCHFQMGTRSLTDCINTQFPFWPHEAHILKWSMSFSANSEHSKSIPLSVGCSGGYETVLPRIPDIYRLHNSRWHSLRSLSANHNVVASIIKLVKRCCRQQENPTYFWLPCVWLGNTHMFTQFFVVSSFTGSRGTVRKIFIDRYFAKVVT